MSEQKVNEIFSQVHNDMAIAEPITAGADRELTDSEKINYLFEVAVKADKLMQEVAPQIVPLLESVSKNPMLKMFLR